MKVISTKWIAQNKGDVDAPKYRARLVGREIAREKRDDLFAATPPLESLKAVISQCASRQEGKRPHCIMSIDIKRAYFYEPAAQPVFIAIPSADWEPGDDLNVAQINVSLHGTHDAAMNWSATYTDFLVSIGFNTGKASP